MREQITTAALEEFFEVGPANASLNCIADRANLELPAVKALYPDLHMLLKEVVNRETEGMVDAIALAVEKIEDPRELMRTSLELFDRWMLEHKKMVMVWLRCSLESADTLSYFFRESLMPSEFFERLEQLIADGKIRCNDLFILGMLLDSLLMFPHVMRPALELMTDGENIEQLLERRFSAIMDLLENGLFNNQSV